MKYKFTLDEVIWYLIIVGSISICVGFLIGWIVWKI
jgi:hypothetical protein